jgi:hypothetical protein
LSRTASVSLVRPAARGTGGALAAGLLLAITAVSACAGSGVGGPGAAGPGTAGGTAAVLAVPITGAGYNNETSIAINPTRPANVIVTYQVPATAAWSQDGGRSWQAQALPGTDRFQLAGDPLVLFDGDGHAYACYIAFDRPEDYDTLGKAAHRNGIYVNRSDDGGRSWRPQAAAVIAQPERPGIPFEDKPMAAVDRTRGGRRGWLYVAWTEFRRWQTAILFARSRDGGLTFSAPVEISDRPGSPKDTVGAAEGTSLGVGPDGTVYVVWSDSTGILLDRSADGGVTWGTDLRIARTPDIVFKVQGVARTSGYPSLAVDPRSGRLYVQWVDRRSGAAAVLLATSDDGGRSWSEPRVASDNSPADPRDRFFAWMALDPRKGALVLGYYRQESPTSLSYRLAWSSDGGRTFQHRPWSAAVFPALGEFLGDYTGVDVYDGVAYAAWAESTSGDTTGARGVRVSRHSTRVVVGRAALP